jgi:CHAT domain-containing protein/tetratricopeptide (TPR) repeat protein
MHKRVQSEISRGNTVANVPGFSCRESSVWIQIAAGLLSDLETRELMSHAAQCGHCGPLLRSAVETLSDETTQEEEKIMADLSSARPEWQSRIARRLHAAATATRAQRISWLSGFHWRPVYVGVGTVGIVMAVWFGVRVLRTPSVNQLLAEAYSQHRTLEVRIDGARYAPLRVERGGSGSSLDKPAALLKAEVLIGENLQKNPSDPSWLEARARADLLDGNYDSAIKSLQRALETQPDSPGLLSDLGSAYYMRARSADRPIDYGNAIESLGKSLANNPDDPIVLFNRALTCEQMYLYTQAVDDWEHYLRVDPQSEWANEARTRLAAVREKLKHRDQAMAVPLLTSSEIDDGESAKAKIDQRFEDYLNVAINDWLPQSISSDPAAIGVGTQAISALRTIAQVGIQSHKDPWLADILSSPASAEFTRAVVLLSQAIRANEEAQTDRANVYASEAALRFERVHNSAGALRARLEHLAASNIDQDGRHCATLAKTLKSLVLNSPYPWLRTQMHIELGTCAWLNEDLGSAKREYVLANRESQTGRIGALHLRAQHALSAIQAACGDFSSGWREAQEGLHAFWSGTSPDVRGYAFYYDIYELGRVGHMPRTQVAAWRDGLRLVESSPDVAQRAMAHVAMANAANAAKMPQIAENEFAQAAKLFAAAPHIRSTRVAELEAEIRLAGVEATTGDAKQAVDRLRPMQADVEKLADNFLSILFYTILGNAEASAGEWDEAERDLRNSISLTDRQLQTVHDDKSRLEIAQQSSGAYRELVQRALFNGDAEGAWKLWERYRAVPLPVGARNALHFQSGETVVSYAILPLGMAVWVADEHGVFNHWQEGNSDEVVARVARFRILCADPNSDRRDLNRNARALYDELIFPVRDHIDTDRTLAVEVDDALEGLPFEALLDEQGHYLGERGPIVTSLGIYYRADSRPRIPLGENAPILIAAVPRSNSGLAADLSPLPDVLLEAEIIAHNFRGGRLLEANEATRSVILSNLPAASVFHFAGHAIHNAQQAGLVLYDGLLTSSSLAAVSLSQMQLAVFSACETQDGPSGALNDAESLVRIFLRAGVPNVVASRWNVDSAATRQFMSLFYTALLRGDSVTQSMHEAQAAMRAQPATSHPYYWSAFSTFGVS